MTSKLEDAKAHLAALTSEHDDLDTQIEAMIVAMASLSPADRKANDWAPGGASTLKYLDLTSRQAEVEAELIDLGRAIQALDGPAAD